jgi:branched-chain amino acid transport system substrate-binding protein
MGDLVSRRRALAALGLTATTATPLTLTGVAKRAAAQAADALRIGLVTFGPPTATSLVNGARLAAEEVNTAGGVLGRPIELVVEDDAQVTAAGAMAAFGRLAARPDVVAFLGPDRSAFVHALAADVTKAGRPMMVGGTDPQLTRMGNAWLFRYRPNDTYSARAMADFGVNTLQARRWAIVHVDDQFGTSGRDALVAGLKRLGVEPIVTRGLAGDAQAAASFAQAANAAVREAREAGADLIASYFLVPHVAPFAEQRRQSGTGTPWLGSPATTNASALERVGPALEGVYAVTDFAAGSSPAAEAFARRYEAAYGRSPDFQSAWTFDAMHLLARSIAEARAAEPEKIRAALLAIRDHQGAEGTYSFDQNGDGLRGYNVVRHQGGRWVFVKRVEFWD